MKLWRSAEGDKATQSKMLEVLESLQKGKPRVPTQEIMDNLKRKREQWIFNTYAAPCLMCITMQLKLVTWQLKFWNNHWNLWLTFGQWHRLNGHQMKAAAAVFKTGDGGRAARNWVKIQWCRVFQFVETSGENKYDKRPGLNLHSCPSSSFPSLCVFIKRPPG